MQKRPAKGNLLSTPSGGRSKLHSMPFILSIFIEGGSRTSPGHALTHDSGMVIQFEDTISQSRPDGKGIACPNDGDIVA